MINGEVYPKVRAVMAQETIAKEDAVAKLSLRHDRK